MTAIVHLSLWLRYTKKEKKASLAKKKEKKRKLTRYRFFNATAHVPNISTYQIRPLVTFSFTIYMHRSKVLHTWKWTRYRFFNATAHVPNIRPTKLDLLLHFRLPSTCIGPNVLHTCDSSIRCIHFVSYFPREWSDKVSYLVEMH